MVSAGSKPNNSLSDAEPDDAPDIHQPQKYRTTTVRQGVYRTHLGDFLTDTGRQGEPFSPEPKDQHRERICRCILVFLLGQRLCPFVEILRWRFTFQQATSTGSIDRTVAAMHHFGQFRARTIAGHTDLVQQSWYSLGCPCMLGMCVAIVCISSVRCAGYAEPAVARWLPALSRHDVP